jgi:hypothetical protein
MAKAEYDKTPLEVAKLSTERLQQEAPWALAVASTGMQQFLGDNFKKNKPVEYENLQNWIAQQLVVTKQDQVNVSNYDLKD